MEDIDIFDIAQQNVTNAYNYLDNIRFMTSLYKENSDVNKEECREIIVLFKSIMYESLDLVIDNLEQLKYINVRNQWSEDMCSIFIRLVNILYGTKYIEKNTNTSRRVLYYYKLMNSERVIPYLVMVINFIH